jgi:hypothetical protein
MRREDEIRNIAYALWVQDGYNKWKALEHWLRAEAIWEHNRKDKSGRELPVEYLHDEPYEELLEESLEAALTKAG